MSIVKQRYWPSLGKKVALDCRPGRSKWLWAGQSKRFALCCNIIDSWQSWPVHQAFAVQLFRAMRFALESEDGSARNLVAARLYMSAVRI